MEQPLRKPGQWTKWFGTSKYGEKTEAEAQSCKDQWDAEDFKAALVKGIGESEQSSTPRYSLDKARKCGELEAASLVTGESDEGRAEWARRQAAATFQTDTQHNFGNGEDSGEMEADDTAAVPSPQ